MLKIALLILVVFTFEITTSRTNFQVKRFELCNGVHNVFPFHGNITKKKDGNQYLNCNVTFTLPVDDNIGAVCKIHNEILGQFRELFVIREKNACLAANNYLGEYWYDIERAAQVMPGACPIRAGKYHVEDVRLRFNKITLQTFPFGRLRFIWSLVDRSKNNQNLLCAVLEVDNVE